MGANHPSSIKIMLRQIFFQIDKIQMKSVFISCSYETKNVLNCDEIYYKYFDYESVMLLILIINSLIGIILNSISSFSVWIFLKNISYIVFCIISNFILFF